MINTSNYAGQDNTPWPAPPTWPEIPAGQSRTAAPRAGSFRAALAALDALAAVGRVLPNWLASLPRLLGDRLFAMNDTEAYWRDWQITRTHGGLARRYRDPRFDLLAECPKCRGAGDRADVPCPPCLGTGRITSEEV